MSPKNYSFLNKVLKKKRFVFILKTYLLIFTGQAQVINYVNNPGFEVLNPIIPAPWFDAAKFWGPIDTSKVAYYLFSTAQSIANAPYCIPGFQYPKSGNNFIVQSIYCSTCTFYPREYLRNRLKQVLKPNTTYCAKFYIVRTNDSPIAVDSYGMYFGDASIDTITQCMDPITYLSPQVQNVNGNIIIDTLNWAPITGTFVANGTEKYMLMGNFKSDAATNTISTGITNPNLYSEYYVDDVSLIELDLPAYAGPDIWVVPGTSVYIGRQSDVGIDEACMWYQLPTVITPTTPAIDTVSGIWVNPVITSTYVVRQQLWCSSVKWDTVVVHMSGVGINELSISANNIQLFPNPVQDNIQIQLTPDIEPNFNSVSIYNNLGQLIREEEITFKNNVTNIKTDDLPNGVYFLQIKGNNSGTVSKRFIINR